ncbi:MAG: hypothetical protein P8Y02_08635 [Deinococcales bacterium]|jgi:hypothetical protein
MDAPELLFEFEDRHADHLVYEGPYRLLADEALERAYADLARLFEEWRQRIYHFDNDLGASAVLYRPLSRRRMRWDVVMTRFRGSSPFAFVNTGGIRRDLRWSDVQRILDRIRTD